MTRRIGTVGLALGGVGLLALALLPALRPPGGPPPTPPGAADRLLTASLRSEPRTFNRYVATDSASHVVSLLTHAKLVRVNRETQDIEPRLAESWTEEDDGLSYRLRLRDGVRFSDGEPLTSADVLFSFEAVYDEAVASPLAGALRVGGRPLAVEAPDASTVIVRFPSAFGPGVRLLDNLPILPRHRLEPALREGRFRDAWGLAADPSTMAGLGPFALSRYVPGQRLELARNPHYWREDEDGRPLPYLDLLRLEIVTDQNTEILQLETGRLDVLQNEIRPQDVTAVRRAAGAGELRLHDLGVGLDPDFLWFNLNPDYRGAADRPWLRRRELRRAIAHGVDRQAFADAVLLGAGVPIHGPVTPANRLWHAPDAPAYEYDPERARALLAEIGLAARAPGGPAADAAGRPARFTLLTQRGHTAREHGAEVLRDALRRIGLTVDVVALDVGALIDRFNRGDYDAMYFGVESSDTDPAVNLDFWLSSGAFHFWHPRQASPATPWERRIDDLMHRQVAAAGHAERKRLFDEVQRIFGEELPVVYFVAPRIFVATGARVANATPVVSRPQVLWNAETLDVR